MTTNELPTRIQIRLLSMTTDDLRNFVAADDRYDYTPEDEARRVRFQAMCQAELDKREQASR